MVKIKLSYDNDVQLKIFLSLLKKFIVKYKISKNEKPYKKAYIELNI